MQFLAYIIAYPILWLISILPFRLLYLLSDFAYILVYHVIGYRKKTVRLNLALCLPELTEVQRKKTEKEFYRHFCDTIFEMAKTMTISDKEIEKRFVFENIELINEYEKKGKSIALFIGHYGSYEWLLAMNRHFTSHKGFGIYKKLANPYFDKMVRQLRGRLGAELIDTKESIPVMKNNARQGILGIYGFISDQSPKIYRVPYWGKFFGMEVPVHGGAELLTKKLAMNVIYVKGEKIKRGHYKATFIPYEGNPKEVPNFGLTDIFLRMLEDQIREAPAYYLWTHKRFKNRRNDPPGYPPKA
ncbi:lysophospholipid acyltransferase family protein [Flavobacterium sp.]|uniref:lysophospholipid acyltransferase family protein n=1 Tax=Flavobacterium sp. TaxID=239 RepID=UPI003A93BB9B